MSIFLASATDRGTSAFISGTPQCANPYLPDTAEHTAWDGGWRNADSITSRMKRPLDTQSMGKEIAAMLDDGATVHVINKGKVVATYAPGHHGPVRLGDGARMAHN